MKCANCGTRFYRASMSGPAEDCDCGMNQTLGDWRREHADERVDHDDDLLEQRRAERLVDERAQPEPLA